MSFDLFEQEIAQKASGLRTVQRVEPGIWDNFLSGTGRVTMQGFAKTGRAVSLAVGGAARVAEQFGGNTETTLSDKWFRLHDDVFQNAVDHWTPKPGEVGAAAEVAGTLLSMLPTIIASPAAGVASLGLSTTEDLARKGVDTEKAIAVGMVQAAGLGLGVWMPILGATGWQRMIVGGAGFNVAQGMVTRGISGTILEGTPAAKDFEAFDWGAVTLDALLGVAFGGLAHLSPAQRAQGKAAWERIHKALGTAKTSDLDALIALRQAEHLNVESAAGKIDDLASQDAHVQRIRKAIDDLANDRPVNVSDLPEPRVMPDPERKAAQTQAVETLRAEADRVAADDGIARTEEVIPVERMEDQPANLLPETAGVEPLQAEAVRFAQANPDVQITVGQNADGTPVVKTVKQYLEETELQVQQAQNDAKLFDVAAACMLGAA